MNSIRTHYVTVLNKNWYYHNFKSKLPILEFGFDFEAILRVQLLLRAQLSKGVRGGSAQQQRKGNGGVEEKSWDLPKITQEVLFHAISPKVYLQITTER